MLALSQATADALAASAGAFQAGASGVLHSVHVASCGLMQRGLLAEISSARCLPQCLSYLLQIPCVIA